MAVLQNTKKWKNSFARDASINQDEIGSITSVTRISKVALLDQLQMHFRRYPIINIHLSSYENSDNLTVVLV